NPKLSYGTSTYDRTHVASLQYFYEIPKLVGDGSVLGQLANGWAVNGVTILQSGFPYNVYDFSGAVAGQLYSHFVNTVDPILPLKPGMTVDQARLQGTTGFDINKPIIDPNAFYIPALAPGENGVPQCTNSGTVCDTFETTYGNTGRNTFRSPFQS